jgi:putative endonuclease
MKSYFVYILKCCDDSYYTGITNNLDRRILEHKSGLNNECYTFSRRPIELMWFEIFNDVSNAIATEKAGVEEKRKH